MNLIYLWLPAFADKNIKINNWADLKNYGVAVIRGNKTDSD